MRPSERNWDFLSVSLGRFGFTFSLAKVMGKNVVLGQMEKMA